VGSIPTPGTTRLRFRNAKATARCLLAAALAEAGILESAPSPERFYVGNTEDLKARVADHNAGRSSHTSKYRPWRLKWYCAFDSRPRAEAFETYLKSASGRAFQKKHIA
jgi:putative endonuclease